MIQNQLPVIAGTDTHSAGLGGTASIAESTAQVEQLLAGAVADGSGSRYRSTGSNGATAFNFAGITTPANSIMVFVIASGNRNTANESKPWIIERDNTTTLTSFSMISNSTGSTRADVHYYVDTNPSAGSHSYQLKQDNSFHFGGMAMDIFFIQLSDSHVGILTGVNGQFVRKRNGIIK